MLSAAKHLFVSSSIAGKCNERGNLNIRRNFSGFSPAMFYAVPNTCSGRSGSRRTNPRHFHECGILLVMNFVA
jgi:hypothetical protein